MNRWSKALAVASLSAALGVYALQLGLLESPFPLVQLVLKGAGVALLAAFAATQAKSLDGWLLVLAMAVGAVGDVAIEFSIVVGAAAFLVGHLCASVLYLRNRRRNLSGSQKALALVVLVAVPLLAFIMPADRTLALLAAIYAAALAIMAATAWTSAFSRYGVGLGAMLFVFSDLLIFAGLGPLSGSSIPRMLIWPAYYIGQYLVCLGVVTALANPQFGRSGRFVTSA